MTWLPDDELEDVEATLLEAVMARSSEAISANEIEV